MYSKVKKSQCNALIILTVLIFINISTRLLFMGKHLEGWDSIDFALGLHDYDISLYQPHFPGYPVYMFFCRIVNRFTENDVLALILPGTVLGSAVVVPMYYLSRKMFSKEAAWLAVLLYMVNPLCWLQSEKALSDVVGLFFVVLSSQLLFYAAASGIKNLRYLVSGSVLLGICLGVRLSYFPFIILWLYILYVLLKSDAGRKSVCYGIFAFIFGICVWLIPLSYYTGLNPLMVNGFSFTSGHFNDWGGSVATSDNVLSRLSGFLWCLFCNGLGFWCYDTSAFRVLPSLLMGAGMLFYLRQVKHSGFDFNAKFSVFYMFPYFLWVFFGQNLEKPRHVLPLIPMILICLSAGLVFLRSFLQRYSVFSILKYRSITPYYLFIGIFLMSMSIISIKLVDTHRNEPSAQIQLLDYVGCNYNDYSTRVYCWETKRLFEYYIPLWDIRRVRNIDDLRYDIGGSLTIPDVILSTSKVNGIKSITDRTKVVVEFRNNRYVNNSYHNLILYDLSTLKCVINTRKKDGFQSSIRKNSL